jgi:hypothetical protein
MKNPADEMRAAAQTLRVVAPRLTGPLAGLADPVAAWLDACADAPASASRAAGLRVARIVNGTPTE